jgi:Ankyrin repeat
MRDQHWEQCHQEGRKEQWFQQTPDEDEIQPLLFDLVRANKVELVKSLLPRLVKCNFEVRYSLFSLAARSGSSAMLDLFEPGSRNIVGDADISYSQRVIVIKALGDPKWEMLCRHGCLNIGTGLRAAIGGTNIENFRHFLLISRRNHLGIYALLLPEILKAKSEEFRLDWEENVEAEYEAWIMEQAASNRRKSTVPFGDRYRSETLLRTATGNPENTTFILLLWEKIDLAEVPERKYLGLALARVAATCRSVKLARYLVDAGAPVDYRQSRKYLTPLHYAVTSDTPEAAELVKFLLGLGADPSAFSESTPKHGKKIRRIRDEVGAKGISKWLGMSWDDLVENSRAERVEVDKTEAESP